MNNGREQLIAYLATLGALVAVFGMAIAAATFGNLGNIETFGLGTITGGLIGILRIPSRGPTGTPADPVATTEADQ